MRTGKQAGKTAKVLLNEADIEAAGRIIQRDPTILNVTDAVRRALHEKDRAQSQAAA